MQYRKMEPAFHFGVQVVEVELQNHQELKSLQEWEDQMKEKFCKWKAVEHMKV